MTLPFWPIVLAALVAIPAVLFVSGMGIIFAAAGYAGGPQESRARTIVVGWFAAAWVLASAFGAFGLAPLWRVWHGGAESLAGTLPVFVDWLEGVGIAGLLGAGVVRLLGAAGRDGAARSPQARVARTLVHALAMAPWGALVAWLAWPLALWPVRGRLEWPDAATGWTHMAEVTALLVAAALVEEAVRRRLKRPAT